MPTRLVHLVIDAVQPGSLGRFWAAALGWEVTPSEPDEFVVWPRGYHYPDPVALPLVLVPVPEAKAGKNRVHLDTAPAKGEDHAAAVAALRSAGAVPVDVGQGVQASWAVLADPEGSEFCVLSPR